MPNLFGESFESVIDAQIREATERGLFDKLPGAGQPLAGLDRNDEAWWIKRKLADEGLALPLPPGLQIRRDVAQFRAHLHEASTEAEVRAGLEKLNAAIRKTNATLIDGPPSNVMPLHLEEVLRDWRAGR